MAHYLVTGGAGFIGSHLAEELARRGHTVRVADSLITGKRSNLDHVPGVEFLEGDLADLAFAHRAAQGIEYLLHQAAIPSVPRSIKDPISSHRANVDGALNVLVARARASSGWCRGPRPPATRRRCPAREDMPSHPSPTLQKVIGEQYCRYSRGASLETVSIRYFNVFRPRQILVA